MMRILTSKVNMTAVPILVTVTLAWVLLTTVVNILLRDSDNQVTSQFHKYAKIADEDGTYDTTMHQRNETQLDRGLHVCGLPIRERMDTVFKKPTTNFKYKIYIYDLPARFNTNITWCNKMARKQQTMCSNFSSFGHGSQLYADDELSVRNTWMFSLEVIIHHKLLHSRYRTYDPGEADMFYIPYYSGLNCLCQRSGLTHNVTRNLEALREYMLRQKAFTSNKPHFMALAKIEREQAITSCPVLRHPLFMDYNTAFVGIEKDIWHTFTTKPFIVVPYPSYGHFMSGADTSVQGNSYMSHLFCRERKILMFLASGTRFRNHKDFRALIIKQLPYYTHLPYDTYIRPLVNVSRTRAVFLATPECTGHHHEDTMKWMKQCIFCLQPSGDSPTRKSFYDAILSGCIPVIFHIKNKSVKYPFDTWLDYSRFTVQLNESDIYAGRSLQDLMRPYTIPSVYQRLQRALLEVLPLMQYSVPMGGNATETDGDAMQYLLQDMREVFETRMNHDKQ